MKRLFSMVIAILMLMPCIYISAKTEDRPFLDVKSGSWYEQGVMYCYTYGYLTGTSVGTFSPGLPLSRGMAVQILYSMSGDKEDFEGHSSFTDVAASKWYHDSVEWAYSREIVSGTGNGCFSPDASVTRQDFFVMLYKYWQIYHHNNQNTEAVSPTDFTDSGKISAYAKEAADWAVGLGFLSGYSDGTLRPANKITRAEICSVIQRYDACIGHKWQLKGEAVDRSCTSDGYAVYICAECPAYIEVTHKSGHIYYQSSYTPPTCSVSGTRVYSCLNCDLTRSEDIPTVGHAIQVTVNQPTCTDNGVKIYKCKYCDITTRSEPIAATGHNLQVYKIPATCISNGYTTYKCSKCALIYVKLTKATDHKWQATQTVKPTRKQQGYTKYVCTVCGEEKKDNFTPMLVDPVGWDCNYDGKLTIDEYLGAYDIADFLAAHKSDYVGTPYKSLENYMDQPWRLLRNIGQYPSNPGMNCTGFIASVVSRCGADLSRIDNSSRGSYVNAYNWLVTANKNNIYHYTFYSVTAALNSGLLQKGDIVLFIPPSKDDDPDDGIAPDFHFGIFWGETPYHNLFWHSTGATAYNRSAGVTGLQNQITGMASGSPYALIYVFPMQRS